jgi:hypothetical protein
VSADHAQCPDCLDVGVRDGDYCSCRMGVGRRTAPRLRIGDDVYVFPPGTSMEDARSVLEEAKRVYLESLS